MKPVSKGDLSKGAGCGRVFAACRTRLFLFIAAVLVFGAGAAAQSSAAADPKSPARPPRNARIVSPAAPRSIGNPAGLPASFLANVQVNVDPGNLLNDFGPAIAVDNSGKIYVVWNIEEAGDEGIYVARSSDGGATFSPAVRVNDNMTYPPSFDAYQPDIAVDTAGAVYVVWHDYRAWADDTSYTSPIDVYLDKSTDGGATWGTDVKVSAGGGYYPWHFQPYIAVNRRNGYLFVSYTDYNRYWPDGDYGDVYVQRSTDGGASFGTKVKADDTGGTAEQVFSSIAVDPAGGHVYVVFQDFRGGNSDIYISKSTDQGVTFGANKLVNDVTVNNQEEPTVRVDGMGNVFVVWKDWRDDATPDSAPYQNDIYVARSIDGGGTFAAGVRVTDEYMNAEVGYNFPPRLAVDHWGCVHVVWHDTRSGTSMCYYDRSLDGGLTFSQDLILHSNLDAVSHSLPRIAEDPRGRVHLTWMDKRNGNNKFDIFYTMTQAYHERTPRHAAGDFDGDGSDELVLDFGASGTWLWDGGSWSLLSSEDPEGLTVVNLDGDSVDEIVANLGSSGLRHWSGGVWTPFSGLSADGLAAGDTDADGSDELAGDFGAVGLWLRDGGVWTQLSGMNADHICAANLDAAGGAEIVGDFGGAGVWMCSAGAWTQLSGVNADYMTAGNLDGTAGHDLIGDFAASGLWLWSAGAWAELSGVNGDFMIALNSDGDLDDEAAVDFGATGLWLWDGGVWTQLSGANADFIVRADVDGNGDDEMAADFSIFGLWLWDGGAWSQLSGVDPEYVMAADVVGDNKAEIAADFGPLGVWLWNEGAWSQISPNNPG